MTKLNWEDAAERENVPTSGRFDGLGDRTIVASGLERRPDRREPAVPLLRGVMEFSK
jgi:hypothetical protein